MVLEKDELVDSWNDGVATYRDDEDGMIQVPFPIRKILDPNLAQRYDTSGNVIGNDYESSNIEVEAPIERNTQTVDVQAIANEDASCNVKNLSLNEFRQRLIRHFNIAFQRDKIVWPRRTSNNN